MKKRLWIRKTAFFCGLVFLFLSLNGCAGRNRRYDRTRLDLFDTVCTVTGYMTDKNEFDRLADGVFEILETWNRRLDVYQEYEGLNNLCTLNSAGGEAVKLDDGLLDFLEWTLSFCEMSGGRVNPVLGSVLSLWHECREEGTRLPAQTALTEAAKHTSPGVLIIDRENSTARLTDPAASVDVGAFGKGYAADMAAEWLRTQGEAASHIALNLGGNICTVGSKFSGEPWQAGIQNPEGGYYDTVNLDGESLATSGSYQRYFTIDGVEYSHIIDPSTLYPADRYVSVSVLAGTAAWADALSTALFLMSPEQGLIWIESIDGAEALWIETDGTRYQSAGWNPGSNK